uniref:Uncharacterized protein LOC111111068 isoform X2 n=1 Tax=Crassostrea virginica TaxID=6565 RepID=A0A8B8BKQ9_CRAVI|nr:uncharacterized protein LOC111111068 isoform X2 [Crassostrea virginica]
MKSLILFKGIMVMILSNMVYGSGTTNGSQRQFLKDYILRRMQSNTDENFPYEYTNADSRSKESPEVYLIESILRPRDYEVTRDQDVTADKRVFNIQGALLKK